MKQKDIHVYDDLIDLPHPVSKRHPQMAIRDRAAQFAPFAALSGHKEAIDETQRLTEPKRTLDENKKFALNEQLQNILVYEKKQPLVRITYFQMDAQKEGGAYHTITQIFKRYDEVYHRLIFADRTWIALDDVYELELVE